MINFINCENEFLFLSREISGLRLYIFFNVFKIIFSDFIKKKFLWVWIWMIFGNFGIWFLLVVNDVGFYEDYICGISVFFSIIVYIDFCWLVIDFVKIKIIFMWYVFILW